MTVIVFTIIAECSECVIQVGLMAVEFNNNLLEDALQCWQSHTL